LLLFCPVLDVQVTLAAGNSSISIQSGPAPNLARQSINIRAALEPLQDDAQQEQQQQQQGALVEGLQQQQQLILADVQLQLVGSHQAGNVQTAAAAALLLRQRGWTSITGEAIAAGLQQAWLPGRFQVTIHSTASNNTAARLLTRCAMFCVATVHSPAKPRP
jgi:folylpolyglutamate synthase/dihydropteroate synthase